MQTVTTIGLDIAKSVFQVHGVDAAGQVVTATPTLPASRRTVCRCWTVASRAPLRISAAATISAITGISTAS